MRVESGEWRSERFNELAEENEALRRRLQHLLQSETVRMYDEIDPRTREYRRDIRQLDASGVPAANWIPVAERLPEEDTPVLTFRANGMEIEFQWNGKWDYDEMTPFHVTHWMPLPKPPKEVKS